MKRQLIYLASGNPHKVRELQTLAERANLALDFRSIRDLGEMPEVVEDTGTFIGNARKKAQVIQSMLPRGAWAMADDSGICVDALGGAPGVESADFAGIDSNDDANLNKLVSVMQQVPDSNRGAHYICVLLLLSDAKVEHVFEGRCHGHLAHEPRGTEGFGYDPLFIPAGQIESLGVLSPEIKRSLSHRAQAWASFQTWFEVE